VSKIVALFLSVKNIYHRCISKVGAIFFKSRNAKFIFISVSGVILATLSIGVTAYFDLPPGSQVARYFDLGAENKTDLLDVVAIADFSGPTRMIGQDLSQGFKDAASAGKISNDVRLIIRDDRGNADAVAALADSAAAGFSTLAVIGPTQAMGYQDMISSLEEGMVPGLVPISPPSMHQNEKWIFALQPSQERQGEFVSNLLLKTQRANSTAFVTYEGDIKNSYAAGFQKVFSKFGKNNFALKIWPKSNDKEAIAQLVKSLSVFDYVAFSLPADDAVQLVRALKDANYSGQLIGFGGASLPNFPERFNQFPKEQLTPGFYTNGLMSVTPFIPSMANERARGFINNYQKR
jgi:ABC-type branched-subunit amino acid transport system substrate-binding protein